ncbi:hypothetical protein IFM89_019748 [Coptis chinensis]|uniref:Uncharacterized protein n=1 Tax=Coptis chinensis TaxID=261450 RepID=A0A835LMT1_9MAGN|nr:hypothetical protein IFM89_019748 [Coptis chinensis]
MIARRIGKPLSWDAATKNRQRLNFARVCVEVNVHYVAGTSCMRNVDGAVVLQEKENNVEQSVDELDGEKSNGVINLEYYPESNVVVNNPFSVLDEEENQETEKNLSDNVPEDDIREEQDIHTMSTSTELVPYVEPNSCLFDALENPSEQVNSFVEECAVYKDMEPVPVEELNNASNQVFNDHIAKKHTKPPIAITSAPVTRNQQK